MYIGHDLDDVIVIRAVFFKLQEHLLSAQHKGQLLTYHTGGKRQLIPMVTLHLYHYHGNIRGYAQLHDIILHECVQVTMVMMVSRGVGIINSNNAHTHTHTHTRTHTHTSHIQTLLLVSCCCVCKIFTITGSL